MILYVDLGHRGVRPEGPGPRAQRAPRAAHLLFEPLLRHLRRAALGELQDEAVDAEDGDPQHRG